MEAIKDISLAKFSFAQKLNLMEKVWTELTIDDEKMDSPAWHEDILKERKEASEAGDITISDWDDAKTRIRRNISCK